MQANYCAFSCDGIAREAGLRPWFPPITLNSLGLKTKLHIQKVRRLFRKSNNGRKVFTYNQTFSRGKDS